MNRNFCVAAFALGLLTIVWVGFGYIGSNPLALIVTLLVGTTYGAGALEMRRFREATVTLSKALDAIPQNPTSLNDWLAKLHPSLRNAVRLRIEGERTGLPGPALTPYLLGLLVMLGMLGTFLGMVLTLNGAAFSLEGSTDLQTMRSSLSAPIKGLGLAFGTSVAGVSASAMLGLISTLCRRERLAAAQLLDAKIATDLRGFSLAHQREETYQALQLQARALPQVMDKLQSMMEAMERQNARLYERLVANQESFHYDVKSVYTELAGSVEMSLKTNLMESVRVTGETIKPVVEATMQGLAREAASIHERASQSLASGLQARLAAFAETYEQGSASLIASLRADLTARDEQRQAMLTQSLEGMAATLQHEWRQAGEQAQAHASRTMAAVDQLMATATEAPRAAAEVIGQLRQELSNSMARDNSLLEERGRIIETLNVLLDAINQGAAEQRLAIDALVSSSANLLDRVGNQFAERIGAESDRMTDMATQVASSAVEISSLSETFGFAVQQFADANEKTIASLERIDTSLSKSMARSDEQLAYYVAQARELIDLSVMSQQRIVEDLQRLSGRQAPRAEAVI
jgi:hypothetical protein